MKRPLTYGDILPGVMLWLARRVGADDYRIEPEGVKSMDDHVDSTSDERTTNNTVRHQYRVLDEKEKEAMLAVKDQGEAFLAVLDSHCGQCRETSIARTKAEEAVMWAVKGITGPKQQDEAFVRDEPVMRVGEPVDGESVGEDDRT